jgi:hypothetical protein
MGHGECRDGECGVCVVDACSLMRNHDVPNTWLVALLGVLTLRPLIRRAAAQRL